MAGADRPVAGPGKGAPVRGDESIDSLRRLGRILTGSPPGPNTDWASMADLARRQGVSPFLYWRLGQRADDAKQRGAMPQEVMEELRKDLHVAAAQVMLAEQQLAAVLGALSTAEVLALVVKGAALGSFYPDPALRLYGDLDILVPETQLDMAEKALNGLGYHCFASKAWWLDRFHHLPPMAREGGGLLVELHWRLDYQEDNGRLPAAALWARAVPWIVHDQPALRLDAVDAALYLCRHAVVQHRAHGAFRSLCDLAQLTEGWQQEEWEMLGQRALEYELARPVYLMLVLAEQALNFTIPAEVVSVLRPSGSVSEPDELMRRLMRADGARPAQVSLGAVQAATEGPFETRLQNLMGSLFLPREGMAAVYRIPSDSPRIWLAYVWRPIDLLMRYGLSAWRALRGERIAQIAWQREVWLERWLRGDEQPDGLEER